MMSSCFTETAHSIKSFSLPVRVINVICEHMWQADAYYSIVGKGG